MFDIHSYEPLWKNWVLDEEIGEGNYGSVWKAHRDSEYSTADQRACIKYISIPGENAIAEISNFTDDALKDYYAAQLARLVKEIEAMIELRGKPHIVSYEEHMICSKSTGFGYDLFLRMELLTSLHKYVELHGAPGVEEVVKLAFHMAKAVATLEAHNYIHRDIKPSNIFVDHDGDFKLGDFGTARVLSQDGNASTQTGTPSFMAPEVYFLSSSYDQTVDLYSLGIVLYYYLNDRMLPFERECSKPDAALRRRISGEKLPRPVNADDTLSAIVLKLCAFDPAKRYQTADELLRDLESYRFDRRRETATSKLGEHGNRAPISPNPSEPAHLTPPVRPRPPIPQNPGASQSGSVRIPVHVPPRPTVPQRPHTLDTHPVPQPVPQPAQREKHTAKPALLIVLILLVVLVIAVAVAVVVLSNSQQGTAAMKACAPLKDSAAVFRGVLSRIL